MNNNSKKIHTFLAGLLVGMLLAGVIFWKAMPSMMITIHESKYDVEGTIERLQTAAGPKGWKVPKVYDIQKSLVKAGHTDMTPLKIVSLCQPDHAFEILTEDRNRMVSAIMPCRKGVYVGDDGKTYVAGLNIGLMSKMFGGTIARVMSGVASEEAEMLETVVKE